MLSYNVPSLTLSLPQEAYDSTSKKRAWSLSDSTSCGTPSPCESPVSTDIQSSESSVFAKRSRFENGFEDFNPWAVALAPNNLPYHPNELPHITINWGGFDDGVEYDPFSCGRRPEEYEAIRPTPPWVRTEHLKESVDIPDNGRQIDHTEYDFDSEDELEGAGAVHIWDTPITLENEGPGILMRRAMENIRTDMAKIIRTGGMS